MYLNMPQFFPHQVVARSGTVRELPVALDPEIGAVMGIMHYLTDERIASAAETLKRDEPAGFEPPVLSERGGMEVSRTRFQPGKLPMLALMYRTPDGKIQQFLFFRR